MEWQFWRRKNKQKVDTCATIESELSLYGDGMASSDERRRIEAHILTCEDCQRSLEWIQATRLVISKRPPVEPPGDLRLRIAQAIAEADSARTTFRVPARPLFLRPAYLMGAAAASVVLIGYFVVAHNIATPSLMAPTVNGTTTSPIIAAAPAPSNHRMAESPKRKRVKSLVKTLPADRNGTTMEAQAASRPSPRVAAVRQHQAMLAAQPAVVNSAKIARFIHAPFVSTSKPHMLIASKMAPQSNRQTTTTAPGNPVHIARRPTPSQVPSAIEPTTSKPTVEAANSPPAIPAPAAGPPASVEVAAATARIGTRDDGLNSVRVRLAAFQSGRHDIKVALRKGARLAASASSQFVMLPAVYSPTALPKSGSGNP